MFIIFVKQLQTNKKQQHEKFYFINRYLFSYRSYFVTYFYLYPKQYKIMKKFKLMSLYVVTITVNNKEIQWATFRYLRDAKIYSLSMSEFSGKVIGKNKFYTDKY